MSSTYEIVKIEHLSENHSSEISARVFGLGSEDDDAIACRVVVTASDGSHPDGGEQGVYADGRFFCEGAFTVQVPSGATQILIHKGPSYVPLCAELDVYSGQRVTVHVWLHRWFAPEDRGWYGGDNHVHSQHDVTAKQKTGLYYTGLQGRANGLSYLTESGSHVSYDDIDQLSTKDFLLHYSPELGGVNYTGHLNTPGLTMHLANDELHHMVKSLLFTQRVVEAAHRQDAAVIYTHPLTPPHQIHWMGATEAFSDAVLGRCADLFDIDSKATELLWFSLLNLGNRLGCSSYTDSTLERLNTLTPGDRRVYCHAKSLEYPSIVRALREGRTFAANGSVFAFFTIDDREPGDTVQTDGRKTHQAHLEIHSLYPLKQVELYRNGKVVAEFAAVGRSGSVTFQYPVQEQADSWYVLRAEDEHGHWCITSPIYFEAHSNEQSSSFASAILFEVSNHTRCIYPERRFFAHALVTVSPSDPIAAVSILKDGRVCHSYLHDAGDHIPTNHVPVTELEHGAIYEHGWVWYPTEGQKLHFQLDYPVTDSGWYAVNVTTVSGQVIDSDGIFFDANTTCSQAMSLAHLTGDRTDFVLWGYGEDLPLDQVEEPQHGSGWYPQNPAWCLVAILDGQSYELRGEHAYRASETSDEAHLRLVERFRPAETISTLL